MHFFHFFDQKVPRTGELKKEPFPSNSAYKWGHPQSSEWTRQLPHPLADSQWKVPPGADWPYEHPGLHKCSQSCLNICTQMCKHMFTHIYQMFTLVFTIMFKLIFIHVYKKKKSLLKDVLLRTHLCLLLLKSEYFCYNNTSGVLGTGLYCRKSAIILPEECGVIVPEEHRYIPIGARLYSRKSTATLPKECC